MARSLRDTDWSVGGIADAMGVSRDTVSRWLNGRTKPANPTPMVWANLTGVDVDWLYAIRDSNPEPAD